MFRGDAAQHFQVKRATWGFASPAPYFVPVLCFEIETEKQKSSFPEDDGWQQAPAWRLDVWARELTEATLLPGSQFLIPSFYDDFSGVVFTNFYYYEHEGTEDNVIKIIRREGDILGLFVEGYIRHEHASMRPTRMTVEADFTRLATQSEIPAGFLRENLPPHEPPYGATYLQPAT
jgi:hypothetical protein